MRVAILSDTHARSADAQALVETLRPHLSGIDHILHAGDVTAPEILDALATLAPVSAVAGNMDGVDMASRWPEQTVVRLGGFRIGLIHGWGAPGDLERKVWERFTDGDGRPTVDAIAYGHSHRPSIETRRGVLMINPGSAADRRGAPNCTFALLELTDRMAARIVPIADPVQES